jgi:membrane-associated phospholipid phosphatase
LRIAADKHWLTDVATGMTVGAAAGIVVPYVFHRPGPNATSLRISPAPGGAAISFSW